MKACADFRFRPIADLGLVAHLSPVRVRDYLYVGRIRLVSMLATRAVTSAVNEATQPGLSLTSGVAGRIVLGHVDLRAAGGAFAFQPIVVITGTLRESGEGSTFDLRYRAKPGRAFLGSWYFILSLTTILWLADAFPGVTFAEKVAVVATALALGFAPIAVIWALPLKGFESQLQAILDFLQEHAQARQA